MASIVRSIATIGVLSASTAARRVAATVGGYFAVAILLLVSMCFLTFAGYLAISAALGSIQASLIVGCAYLFLGLLAALVMQSRHR